MIDFHSHILPGVDDGSKSIDETRQLLSEAAEAGFEIVISTSHYIEGYYEADVQERKNLVEQINSKLIGKNENISIHLGNEVYITSKIIDFLKEGKVTTVEGTNYILFELPMNIKPMNLNDVVYDLLQYKLVPVLAHPERYSFIQDNPNLVGELIDMGVLMQANFGSIIGQYGVKEQIIVRKLLANRMIHFLGTDVHRKNTVYPKIPKILNEIEKIVGGDELERLTEINPKLVLQNKEIDIDDPKEIQLSLREKLKLKRNK